jgi:AcrR family transcriptional regulator
MARTVGSAAVPTRRRILDAATELFVERGFAGTSIRDIAEHLGMTKGSLYYHFSSKEELLLAMLGPLIDAIEDFVAAARPTGTPSTALVRRLVEMLDEHRPVLRAMLADPAVVRAKARGYVPERIAELQQLLNGAPDALDSVAMLRARCALAVIHAGVLAPHGEECGPDGSAVPRQRLAEQDKEFITRAALAVLGIPIQAMVR